MKLTKPIEFDALKDWEYLSLSIDYVSEVVTEYWINPQGKRTTLYRRYGAIKDTRYWVAK